MTRLRLKNASRWRTDDLRRFLLAAIHAHGDPTRGYLVRVSNARRPHTRGLAFIGYPEFDLWIPNLVRGPDDRTMPEDVLREAARVTVHEIAHTLGLRHGEMDRSLRACRPTGDEDTSWANGLLLRMKEVKAAPKPADRVAQREERSRDALARWERRLALAKTKVRTYRRKVAYYERRAAAGRGGR